MERLYLTLWIFVKIKGENKWNVFKTMPSKLITLIRLRIIKARIIETISNICTDFNILWRTELFLLDPFRILLDSVQENINNWILSVSALAILGMSPTTRLWKIEVGFKLKSSESKSYTLFPVSEKGNFNRMKSLWRDVFCLDILFWVWISA